MLSAGGHVPTHTLAPASASALAIANPKPGVVGHARDERAAAGQIDVEHARIIPMSANPHSAGLVATHASIGSSSLAGRPRFGT